MDKWHLIQNQPLLREIFKEPPLISYRKGKSLKDMLVKASMCNKLFDTLFLPILLYSSEVWGAYDNIDLKNWDRDPIEKLHTQFYKYYLT